MPHNSPDNVKDTCIGRCSKLGFDHGDVFWESQMLSLDLRGFANGQEPGKNQGKMNMARHLMFDAGNNAEWPRVADEQWQRKCPKQIPLCFAETE